MGKKYFCELVDTYWVWHLIHVHVQNKRNWEAQALFSYIRFSFWLLQKPLENCAKEMQEFLPDRNTSQNFLSLETFAAFAIEEKLGCEAH